MYFSIHWFSPLSSGYIFFAMGIVLGSFEFQDMCFLFPLFIIFIQVLGPACLAPGYKISFSRGNLFEPFINFIRLYGIDFNPRFCLIDFF